MGSSKRCLLLVRSMPCRSGRNRSSGCLGTVSAYIVKCIEYDTYLKGGANEELVGADGEVDGGGTEEPLDGDV